MAPVKKPKAQQIAKQASPTKKPEAVKSVVSGQIKKKLPKAKPEDQKERKERGIVFIKHLPHGFFEQQLRQYFKQFGRVLRVRLARSPRSGNSKGFAFVEFEYPEVAKVAADTMDNYLMFQKVVKASYIPPENQKFNYFKSSVKRVHNKAGKEIYVSEITKRTQNSVKKQNNWNEASCQKRTVSNLGKIKKIQEKYNHLGIDFSSLIVEPIKKSKESPEANAPSTSEAAKSSKKQKKAKEVRIEDLLGTTIDEDSDDEDYVDASEDESDLEFEDEESAQGSDDTEDSDEEQDLPPPPKKSQKKNPPVARLEDKLKRKHGAGGVQKKKPAPAPKANKNAVTQKLQLAAAKTLAKPLQKVKSKKLKK
ncbi:GL13812 [Drosophila persimilis]|uniref:GL13812 n=1 Tax=Drosophila persimilis TaxID=7234 RepID=B4GP43_DROPE|nr:MKI67 FHA domain-interacting nucleolar phosphoprotein [Drosophila persimilis]EDW38926.1 GL13812 [Drosophila persimilis]